MHMTTRLSRRLICLALLAFCAQPLHAQSQSDQGSQTMEHAQIQSTIDKSTAAVSAHDIDGILSTYEPAAAMVGQPGMPAATGTAALREAFKSFLALDPKITMTSSEVIVAGDIALHSYTWKMSGKTPDGAPLEQGGLAVVVLRKQPDGSWLMVIDNPFGDHLLHRK
jgi:uncharacterized protein (TIGR02246 family)